MAAQSFPDVIPEIKKWAEANSSKIDKFWVGADWRNWARYEIFTILDKAFGEECLVTHTVDLWENSHELIDILLDPRDEKMGPLAIRLRCEKVNENEGSFETFSKQYQEDWRMIQTLANDVESDFEGSRVMLLGFSGEEVGDEGFSELKPETFKSGNVNGWYIHFDSLASK